MTTRRRVNPEVVPRRRVAEAFIWRSFREQRFVVLAFPVGFGLALVALTVVIERVPNLLTSQTRSALQYAAQHYLGSTDNTHLALGLILFQAPALLTVVASMSAASIAQALLGDERSRGGLELLSAAPFGARRLYLGIIATVGTMAAIMFVLLTIATVGVAFVVLEILSVTVKVPSHYWVFVGVLPLPVALLAASIASYITLRFPGLSDFRTGTLNAAQSIAVLPAIFLLLFVTLHPDIPSESTVLAASAVALSGALVLLVLVGNRFRPAALLP